MSQQINLYNPVFRKQAKVFAAAAMLQGVVLIMVVVGVLAYTIAMHSSLLEIRAADSARQLKGELERLKAHGGGQSPAERAKALAERTKKLEANLAGQTQALQAYETGTLGRTEGYSGLMRALARVSMEGVWLTQVRLSEGSRELSLTGRATRAELVPAYLERLRSEEALRGRTFSRLDVVQRAAAPAAPGAAGVPFVEFVLSSSEAAAKSGEAAEKK